MASYSIAAVLSVGITIFFALSKAATNPGVRLRVTDKGLEYVDQIAVHVLDEKIKTASIPDISGDADTPLGSVSYTLSSMHFSYLSIPSSTLKTVRGVGIKLQISGGSASLSGDWRYRKNHWFVTNNESKTIVFVVSFHSRCLARHATLFSRALRDEQDNLRRRPSRPHISDSGSFDLSVSGLALTLSSKVGADSKGHPTIAADGCSCSVGSADIHFHGGASWLYNLFDSYVDKKIRGALQDKLCSEATDVINNDAAKALATFPVEKQIDQYAVINYSLLSNPNVTDTCADLFLKGEFQSATKPKEAPFSPVPLPPDSESDKMTYVWVTDYVINTAGFVYHNAGAFNKTITPSDLPPNFSYPLNTNTFKLVIPKLYKLYPNCPMNLVVYTTAPPTVTTATTGVSLVVIGHAEAFVKLQNGSYVYTFTIGVKISGSTKIAVKGENVTWHVDFLKVNVSLVHSAIGNIVIDMKLLQLLFDAFVDNAIVTEINKYGDTGFPLPHVDGIELINTEVAPGKGFNLIAADVSYNPSQRQSKKSQDGRTFAKITII